MVEFLTYVPWDEGNANVWSPRLANLLINIGSSVDSTFKTFKNSRSLAAGKDAQKLRDKEEPNIGDYATTYGTVYPLESKVVHFLQDHSPFRPWHAWKETPFWWYAYNQVKHNRFGNLKLAKLRTTLDALTGFFSVCVLLLEVRSHLFSLGRIRHVGLQKRDGEIRMETWMGGVPLELIQVQDLGDRYELPVYVNSNLFVLFLSSDKNAQGQQELLEQIAPR